MRSRHGRRLLPAVLFLSLVVAVTSTPGPCIAHASDSRDAPRWHVRGAPVPGLPWGGCRRTRPWSHDFYPVELPEAHHARGRFATFSLPPSIRAPAGRADDDDTSSRTLVVNVDAEGRAYFKQFEFSLDSEDLGERHAAQWALGGLLADVVREETDTEWTAIQGTFDRAARWSDVRVCLRAAIRSGIDTQALEIPVRGDVRHAARFMPLRLRRRELDESLQEHDFGMDATERARLEKELGEGPIPPDAPAIHVSRTDTGTDARTRIRYAGQTFTFPAGDRFNDATFVQEANATWAAFAHHAAAQPREAFTTLMLDEALDVPWAYVLTAIDVLADQGVTILNLPSAKAERHPAPDDEENKTLPPYPAYEWMGLSGMALEILPLPPPLPTPDCGPLSRAAPHWLWLVLAGVAATCLALLGASARVTRRRRAGA